MGVFLTGPAAATCRQAGQSPGRFSHGRPGAADRPQAAYNGSMASGSREEFIGEQMTPVAGTADAAAMARGEPGVPGRFVWRGEEYRVARVIEKWKTSGPCRSGADELYLRRHWYRIAAEPSRRAGIMTIYCDRQAKNRKRPKSRWFVYTIERAGAEASGGESV